jgi:peptidoglycan/LPS O-acetylase OafA/YrhL
MLHNRAMGVAAVGNNKILHLESLRGIAALGVALHHSRMDSPIASNAFIDNSWLMVDFFFVLSGFVIALNYQDAIRSGASLLEFQYRRFFRLYPLHLVMLLVFLLLECAKGIAASVGGLDADTGAFAGNNLFTFLASLTLTQSLFLNSSFWNGPSWSISAEFCTYALFGVMAMGLRRSRVAMMGASCAISVAGAYYVWKAGFDMMILRCLLSFFIGVIAFNMAAITPKRDSGWGGTVAFAAVVGLLLSRTWDAHDPWAMIFPPAFGAMLYMLVTFQGRGLLKTVLEYRPLVYLGTISYGVYMVHWAVWWMTNQILRFGLKVNTLTTPNGGTIIHIQDPWFASAVVVVGLTIILTLAHLSYRYLERPVIEWSRRGRAEPLPGALGTVS